jgi:hypothetical protein
MLRFFQLAPVMVGLLLAAASSCARGPDGPEYSIGFFNDTPGQIDNARADWKVDGAARHQEGGVMDPSVEAVFHQVARPIPGRAAISWKTGDGMVHRREVEVSKLIADPAKFSGTVYFKIAADGSVKAVPLTYDEIHRLAFSQKPYP